MEAMPGFKSGGLGDVGTSIRNDANMAGALRTACCVVPGDRGADLGCLGVFTCCLRRA